MESLVITPSFGERICEIFERAPDPTSHSMLLDLYISRIEAETETIGTSRRQMARLWRQSRRYRCVELQEILSSRATVRFIKGLFNWYFQNDLYGDFRSDSNLILSSGSLKEAVYPLPAILKSCVGYSLGKDWYGHSDSRGRLATRCAIAALENSKVLAPAYGPQNVAVTLGGTSAVSSIADMILHNSQGRALCALPNYPPLVEAIAKRGDIELVPLTIRDGRISLAPLLAALQTSTPLILLQTVCNPSGSLINEDDLQKLILRAAPNTIIVLDECHECLGPEIYRSRARWLPNVVRVMSLSKYLSAPGLKIGWITASEDFINAFYEYASTTYGSPPSIFYLLLEVFARMETWLIDGTAESGELDEPENVYSLSRNTLAAMFENYKMARLRRDNRFIEARHNTVDILERNGSLLIHPTHSINICVSAPGFEDSYAAFRCILNSCGVSVFPGVLSFCAAESCIRITPTLEWPYVRDALGRISEYLVAASGEIRSPLPLGG